MAPPSLSNKACRQPGCYATSTEAYCEKHKPARFGDPQGRTVAERGYGARWQRLRKVILKRDPLCVRCRAEGKTVPTREIDHIIPIRVFDAGLVPKDANGGKNSRNNLQGLCGKCHREKTRADKTKWGPLLRRPESHRTTDS